MTTLTINHTWDGQALPPHLHATVELRFEPDHLSIEVEAPFAGDPAPQGPIGPTDALWEFEVVEVFLLGDDQRYLEVELGPHGHHLVLDLHGVRKPTRTHLPMDYECSRTQDRWRGSAQVPLHYIPTGELRGNAYRIAGHPRTYMASTPVPGPAPDFHRLEFFPGLNIARRSNIGGST